MISSDNSIKYVIDLEFWYSEDVEIPYMVMLEPYVVLVMLEPYVVLVMLEPYVVLVMLEPYVVLVMLEPYVVLVMLEPYVVLVPLFETDPLFKVILSIMPLSQDPKQKVF